MIWSREKLLKVTIVFGFHVCLADKVLNSDFEKTNLLFFPGSEAWVYLH